jgi:hypothetical protein
MPGVTNQLLVFVDSLLRNENVVNLGWIPVKQCHKPAMTGNGDHTTHKHGDFGDGLYSLWHCFAHINVYTTIIWVNYTISLT